ncbi:MAG TPA: endonuclease MutS2 [Longilinea sp.]|nr:endonuclease MutS2 [Longilinea sp.]
MDEKTLQMLEFSKVLERLAGYAAFSASAEKARNLLPSTSMEEVKARLARTSEARRLLSTNLDASVGGAYDIRAMIELARRGGILEPNELLTVKSTLMGARELARVLERHAAEYPYLAQIAFPLPPPSGIIESISRCISERAEVMDCASEKLGKLRVQVRIAHERLLSKLERLVNDPKTQPMLQEALITQRNGRYVIPLRADFKGKVRSIIHDQSSSGATLFVEPLAIVEMNNEWHELELQERDEVRRILAVLAAEIGDKAPELEAMLEALAEIDLALMCAKYAEDLHAAEPVIEPYRKMEKGSLHPGSLHPGSLVRLYHARHPLLDPNTVVPIDIDLDEQTYTLVITGPNTGGKTVTLKTVGLFVLMSQSGLHIPAQSGSALSIFQNVFADIGDEQSIEQSLSTFSGHITNIVRILRLADRNSLVLLDELGAGTDPQEGSALARAILSDLVGRGITSFIATHYPELKTYAHSTSGVVNASMEFDLSTLRPTYHLTIGLPGRSNALSIAERLGLSFPIIQAARTMLDPNDLRAEDLLDEIHRQRDLTRKARDAAEQAQRDAEALRSELHTRLEKVEDERRTLLEKAREEAEKETESIRTELDDIRRQLTRARQPLETLKAVEEKVEQVEETVQAPVERRRVSVPKQKQRALRLGDRVHLRTLDTFGTITVLGENEAEVQVGAMRIRSRLSDIERPSGEPVEEPVETAAVARAPIFHASPGMELDLRGQRAEDALEALDRYLESAFLAGMPFVRIIHGKGTGRLRQVIREALQKSPHVDRFEQGLEQEGGDGVTVAHMGK